MPISEKRRSELASRTDEQIDYSDIAELYDAVWAEAKVIEPDDAVHDSYARTLKKTDA